MKVQLYNDDCIRVMQKLADEGVLVDMILADPPYLVNYKTNHRKNKSHDFCSPILNDDNPQLIIKFIGIFKN